MLATIKSLGYGRRGEEEQQSPVLWPWICRLKEKTNKNKKTKQSGGRGWIPSKPSTFSSQTMNEWKGWGGVGGGQQKSLLHILCNTQMSGRAAYG